MPREMGPNAVLAAYLNKGEDKLPARDFKQQLDALDVEERVELAAEAAEELGLVPTGTGKWMRE